MKEYMKKYQYKTDRREYHKQRYQKPETKQKIKEYQ